MHVHVCVILGNLEHMETQPLEFCKKGLTLVIPIILLRRGLSHTSHHVRVYVRRKQYEHAHNVL